MFRLVGEGECIAIQKAWQEDHMGMILLDQMMWIVRREPVSSALNGCAVRLALLREQHAEQVVQAVGEQLRGLRLRPDHEGHLPPHPLPALCRLPPGVCMPPLVSIISVLPGIPTLCPQRPPQLQCLPDNIKISCHHLQVIIAEKLSARKCQGHMCDFDNGRSPAAEAARARAMGESRDVELLGLRMLLSF